MFELIANILPLAQAEVIQKWTTYPAISPWILIPGVIALVVLIYYLYTAQSQIASRRIVSWLTAIRVALILLLGLLLLRPTYNRRLVSQSNETLWVLLDQSLSMAQKDPQATPIERLRWADALGMLPPESRPSKLDLSAARLHGLHDDLLRMQRSHFAGGDEKQEKAWIDDRLQELKAMNDHLVDIAAKLDKDPKIPGGEAATLPADLRNIASDLSTDIGKAAQHTRADEVTQEVRYAQIGGAIDAALAKLNPLADSADNEFLSQHGSDPAVSSALNSVQQLRRADIAYQALTGKARDLPRSMVDVLDQQHTRVVAFAGSRDEKGQQDLGFVSKSEIPKVLKAALEPTGGSTNLADALRTVSENVQQGERASILIISDGRLNEGGDPTDAAQRLAARGVRVFALGLGSKELAPDAAVESVDAPDWIFKDDTVKASALLRLDGLAGQTAKVEFLRGSTVIDTQSITPTSNQATSIVTFKDKPPEPQVYEYTVRVQEMPKEVVKENNVQTFRVSVKNDKLKVLIVEDQPRWEDRYLANYLKRDTRVHLQQVLLEAANIAGVKPHDPIKASPTNDTDMAQVLPATAEEWSAYDLIVLGDIPVEYLTPETQKNIAKAVRDRGATLLVIAGPLNMPARYTASPLAELLPVHLASNWTAATLADHVRRGFSAKISAEGANSVLSQLGLDDKTNSEYWSQMPSWYWHSEQTQAKQSASVIWEIADAKPRDSADSQSSATAKPSQNPDSDSLAEARQRALLCTMPVGSGRVMYLASDSTWRLRQVNGVNLHERLWGQVIRWVVQSDMPAGGKFVRFGASKPRYVAGEPVIINVRLTKKDFTPLAGQTFKIVASKVMQKDPASGQIQTGAEVASADAVEIPGSPGMYRATLNGLDPGAIEISVRGAEVEKMLADDPSATQKTLMVDLINGSRNELKNVNADPNMLKRLAEAGNGVASDIAYTDVLAQHIPNLQKPQVTIEQIGLFADQSSRWTRYAHWGFLILFVTLITLEWILRKAGGLV